MIKFDSTAIWGENDSGYFNVTSPGLKHIATSKTSLISRCSLCDGYVIEKV